MRYDKYSFEELAEKALARNAAQEDINALGEWFEEYGSRFWNGESYDIDGSHSLRPVLEPDTVAEDGYVEQWKRVGFELF